MQRVRIFLIVLLLFFFVGYFLFNKNEKLDTIKLPLFYGAPASIGYKDNPNARRDWEILRLQNPAIGKIPSRIRIKETDFAKNLPSDYGYQKAGGLSWMAMGPYNVGGRTRAAAIDVSNENVILAGGVSGGLWRSTDNGASWNKVTASDQHQSITCIAQDTRVGKTHIWYYGTGEAYGGSASAGGAAYFGNGVYKSVDGGLTWTSLTSTVSGTPQLFDDLWDAVWNIAVAPVDTQDVAYAAVMGAIFRTIDGGISWSKVLGGNLINFAYFTDVAVTSSGIIYATISSDGLQKGIWRSTDGITWVNITPAVWPAVYNRIVVGITPSNEDVVYFLASTPGSGQMTTFFGMNDWNSLWRYTYLSGDGSGPGGAWVDLSANLPSTNGELNNYNSQGSYDMVIKVKPDDSNMVFIGGTNLFRSTDGFTTPDSITMIGGYLTGTSRPYYEFYSNHFPDQHEILFMPSNPNIMLSANDGGIFKTTDCSSPNVTWSSLNNGYLTSQFYTVAIDHGTNNSNVIIGGLQDVGSWFTNSNNPSDPWTMPSSGDGAYCAITDSGNYYYFSRELGKVLKVTLDVNGIPTAFTRIDPIGGSNYLFINPFILDPVDNDIMYLAGGYRLWRNDDLSQIVLNNQYDSISTNWFQYTNVQLIGEVITALAASKAISGRLCYGTDKGRVYRLDNADVGDPVPVNITGALFPFFGYVSSIALDPRDADKIIVVFSNYSVYSLFYTIDGGITWEKGAGNLEQFSTGAGNGPSCRWISVLPIGNKTVYLLGTSIGLYATDTLMRDSTVWIQQGANVIGNVVVDMVDVRESDGFVVIGTHGNGVYTAHITSANDLNAIRDLVSDAKIQFNTYPNPASTIVNLEFYLPQSDRVVLNIYDVLGKKMITICNRNMNMGMHSIRYKTQQLASGVYFCYLATTQGKVIRKFIIDR